MCLYVVLLSSWLQGYRPLIESFNYYREGGAGSLKEVNTDEINRNMKDDYQASSESLIQCLNAEEILSYLISSGTIDMDGVETQMKEARRKDLLDNHPNRVYQGSDGRWRTYVKDESKKTGRKLIVKSSLEDLQNAVIDHYMATDPEVQKQEMTLASLFEDWIAYKSLHVVESTVIRDRQTWNRYYEGSDIIHKPIMKIKKLDLDIWVHEMIRKYGMNKHQYNSFRTILGQELDYAVDREIIDHNPFREVHINGKRVLQPEHKKPDQTQVYSQEELHKLREIAWQDFRGHRHKVHQLTPLAVMFMFLTGMRIGEVCVIRYEDMDGQTINIRRLYRHWTKEVVDDTKGTFGDRRVPLIPEAMELIEAARQWQRENGASDTGYIFSMNEEPLMYSAVQKAFYKYCRDMGIAPKSSHKARKTFVSTLIDGGVNINTVRQYAGHKDERTTLGNYCYDRSSDEEKTRQMREALTG